MKQDLLPHTCKKKIREMSSRKKKTTFIKWNLIDFTEKSRYLFPKACKIDADSL